MKKSNRTRFSRRDFLNWSALAGAGATVMETRALASASNERERDRSDAPTTFNEATIAELQAAMETGRTTSVELTRFYLERIKALDDKGRSDGPGVNSVLEINPDAFAAARTADAQRRQGKVLGPLHGIPVLLKDNIDTGDGMQTTAGSLALAGAPATRDSTVAAKLRAGGAVLLGKTTLSEWANFRSTGSTSGWSGRGGQCHNPYALDRNPSGSSSGSAAAASANFCAVAIGSETDGSIVSPSGVSGVVGLKPTVGLVSRAGVIPISHTQDTVGPHARTVADAAAVLSVIASQTFDGRDAATGGVPLGWLGRSRPTNLPADYTQFVDPGGLHGTRIGVTRRAIDDGPQTIVTLFDDAIAAMVSAGATVVDLEENGFAFPPGDGEFLVLLFDFVVDLRNYFATRVGVPMAGKTLNDAIAFNIANAAVEMPFFGQELFEIAVSLKTGPDDPQEAFDGMTYNAALEIDRLASVNGIDKALADFNLDAIAAPTGTPAWPTDYLLGDRFILDSSGLAAVGGYPVINVPLGNVFGLPMGLSFLGTAFSEPTLIKVASGFENATKARIAPTFADNLPSDNQPGEQSGDKHRRSGGSSRGHEGKKHFRPHHM
jgi:amidase